MYPNFSDIGINVVFLYILDYPQCGILLSIPYLLRENAHNLFHIDADNALYPRIECSEVGTGDDDIEHVLK